RARSSSPTQATTACARSRRTDRSRRSTSSPRQASLRTLPLRTTTRLPTRTRSRVTTRTSPRTATRISSWTATRTRQRTPRRRSSFQNPRASPRRATVFSTSPNSTARASCRSRPTARPDASPPPREVLPRIPSETFGDTFPWPLDPQTKWHEVSATMGEVRGAYDSSDSRDHLHAGLDVFGLYGQTVRAVREEKISSPLPNWGFGTLNE